MVDAAAHLALRVVALCSSVVPADQRAAWRRQWTADLVCQADWLSESGHSARSIKWDLFRRSTGALRHAFWLRTRQWRNPMIRQDLVFAWRSFSRRPGFTLAIVLTLGLGVGANATIFSWIDALVLSPLPGVQRASELALVRFASPTRNNLSFSYPNFRDVRERKPDALTGLASFAMLPLGMRTSGEPERVWAQAVSGNFFDVLEVTPARGRTLQMSDEGAIGGAPVAVISDRLWRTRFNASESAVGSTFSLNEHPFTIVGVMPDGFIGAAPAISPDLWVPVTMHPTLIGRDVISLRGNGWMFALGRRNPAASPESLKAALSSIASQLVADKSIPQGWTLRIAELREEGAAQVLFPVLSIVMGVVAIVLLIACGNVSSLLLSRAVARQREIAIRAALGASRWHLLRQLLVESLLLAVLGGVAGVALTIWTSRGLSALLPPLPFPVLINASVNPRVMGFSAVLVVLATVVFGLAPALQGSRTKLQNTLRSSGTAEHTVRRARWRRVMVAGQLSLATVLLVSAGLFIRTLLNAYDADPGFSRREGVLASFDLSSAGYDAAKGRAVYTSLLAALSAMPEVESASVSTILPLSLNGGSDTSPVIDGYTPKPNEEVVVFYGMVGPRYFDTMGVSIVEGRPITEDDREASQAVVVINQTMAKRYWPGRSAVGGRLRTSGEWATVVGVAKDGKYSSLTEAPRSVMYLPIQQIYRSNPVLHVATRGAAGAAIAPIRRTVARIAPELALYDVRTIREHLQISVAVPRVGAILLVIFGALALALAAIGLYGVVAFAVSQRTREIGVRMALGADRSDILRQVLGEATRTAVIGLVVGVGLAIAAAPALKSLMVNVSATDPLAYGATVVVLFAVALVAAWIPARRAASVDPVDALRTD